MSTFYSLRYHLIFSTKERRPWITPDRRSDLHAYLGGTVRGLDGVAESVGGVADHVHLLLSLKTTHTIADFVRDLKRSSSRWVHEQHQQQFAWQEGYSVFSVSKSQEPAVKKYIADQAKHHKKEDFKSELRRLLRAHGIEFDEQYVFE